MDNYNQILLNKAQRDKFIIDVASNSAKGYKDGSVSNALRDLIASGIITSMNDEDERQAKYMVNPEYFWKTKMQSERIEAIRGFNNKIKENE